MQSNHSEFICEKHALDIVILCDGLSSPANIGGVLRLADAYGVLKVVFLGSDKKITPAMLTLTNSSPAYRGALKKYLPITLIHVIATIQNNTIAAMLEIKRLTPRASRSIMLRNKVIIYSKKDSYFPASMATCSLK